MKTPSSLWIGVALLFALLGCAWTAMFFFARQARVESVPLPRVSPMENPTPAKPVPADPR